jgi:polysaccharide chain length determinant protein (PEP-CTERM system associated)
MFEEVSAKPALSVQDYWAILCRRRWWLLFPFFICWLGTWSASWIMPAKYRSETLILVEQQKVPAEYVVANVSVDLRERIQSMTQQILSRTRLQQIIEQFKLYSSLAKRLGPDGAIEQMRKDINIELVEAPGKRGDFTAFRISYSAPSAQLAQVVATQITSLFIDQNIQEQSKQAENTTEFLSSELEDVRQKLAQQEARVKEFKGQHMGELPTQMDSNVHILTGLQDRYQNLTQALNRAQEQKLYLESLLNQYRNVKANSEEGAITLPALDQELSRLRAALANAQTKYTDKHPDVIHLKGQIAKTEKLKADIEADLAKSAAAGKDKPPTTPAQLQAMSPALQIEGQLRANEQEIQDVRRQQQQLEGQIGAYQVRLNATPVREQQLADLTRDYEQSKSNYESLLKKQMQSQLATNLEKRQQGQQFRIIDPPGLPTRPYSPDRTKFNVFGLIGGLLLGLGCLAFVEYLDDYVRGSNDVKIAGVKVLVGIPHLTTPEEERKQSRWHVAEWCAGFLIVLTIIAGNVFTFYKG